MTELANTTTTPPTTPATMPLPAVRQVIEWLASGAFEYDIAEALAVKFPELDPVRTIALARRQINRMGGLQTVAVQMLYHRAVDTGDIASATRLLTLLMKLSKAE